MSEEFVTDPVAHIDPSGGEYPSADRRRRRRNILNRGMRFKPMKRNAILIHHADNVVTATEPLDPGGIARYLKDGKAVEITVTEPIPKFHKIAVIEIPESNHVIKYGQVIGVAVKNIPKGSHVHDHNIKSPEGPVQSERMG
jgi:altronate dehydratase small subunit